MDSVNRLTTLLKTYPNRQCLLFVGAGFSKGAQRKTGIDKLEQIPVGRDLTNMLRETLGEDSDDLGTLSELYEEQYGEHGLFALLSSLFVACISTDSQNEICKFKWKEIYTTNYDNVLEICHQNIGSRFSIYTPLKKPTDVEYRTLPIIHINGAVAGATFGDFKQELKLTDTQYFSDDFSRSAWGERFRNDIITSPCIVFAGYSLYDLDVARILHSFEGMQERIFFIIQEKPSRILQKKTCKVWVCHPHGCGGLSPYYF